MDSEQWLLLERCFRLFPAAAVAAYPDLLLTDAWLANLSMADAQRVLEDVDRVEELVSRMTDQPEHAAHLSGEIDSLRAIAAHTAAGEPERVIALARRALATTPRPWYFVRAAAWLRLALAHQMIGNLDRAYATLAEGQLEDVAPDGAARIRVAAARGLIEWTAGDLQAVTLTAPHLVSVGQAHHYGDTQAWAHYFHSSAAYQRDELLVAAAHAGAAEQLRYAARPMCYLQSTFVAALIQQARGLPDQAQQPLDLGCDFLRETRCEGLLPLAQAFRAELALLQGDRAAASHWAATIGPLLPLTAMMYSYAPQLTLPKILLAQDTPASRQQAAAVLSRLNAFVTSTHNVRFTIEVLALQALVQDAQGEGPAALARLGQAVSLAEPGGFIRLFVYLGPRMANLLDRLRRTGSAPGSTGQILQAFGASTQAAPSQTTAHGAAVSPLGRTELVEPLSEREREVLALLAQRLSNKEIAQTLVISPQTVKRRAANLYQKLQASSRREAVANAIRLGLLQG